MLETLILAGGLGFLLGLRFRVAAVIFASTVVAPAATIRAYLSGESLWTVLLSPVLAVIVCQLCYLCGVLVTVNSPRSTPAERRPRGEQRPGEPPANRPAGEDPEQDRSAKGRAGCFASR